MTNTYIIYATNNSGDHFYIMNKNPIVYSKNPEDAKKFASSENAEYVILRDFDNYNQIKQMFINMYINGLYIAEVENGWKFKRSMKIL